VESAEPFAGILERERSITLPCLPPGEFTKRANVMTDAELARTTRETYWCIVARNRGTTQHALRTCEVMLRIHRATEGREADRARIARMLSEEPRP
jgi:hypothetical protein